MRGYIKSLGHAFDGLVHAFLTERNLRLFGWFYVISLAFAVALHISLIEWGIVVFSGGMFLAIELVNTALEHFSDAFDTHSKSIYTPAIKATKDIAAAASLICGVAWGFLLCILFLPHLWEWWIAQWEVNMTGM